MQFFGRLRHPVQQKDSILVDQVISEIRIEVERLGFVLTGDEECGTYFTAKVGRNLRVGVSSDCV